MSVSQVSYTNIAAQLNKLTNNGTEGKITIRAFGGTHAPVVDPLDDQAPKVTPPTVRQGALVDGAFAGQTGIQVLKDGKEIAAFVIGLDKAGIAVDGEKALTKEEFLALVGEVGKLGSTEASA